MFEQGNHAAKAAITLDEIAGAIQRIDSPGTWHAHRFTNGGVSAQPYSPITGQSTSLRKRGISHC